jgi:Rieske Fe-S protein
LLIERDDNATGTQQRNRYRLQHSCNKPVSVARGPKARVARQSSRQFLKAAMNDDPICRRRAATRAAALAASALFCACARDRERIFGPDRPPPGDSPGTTNPPGDEPVTLMGNLAHVDLARAPTLAAVGGHLIALRAQLVVLRPGVAVYRAFTNVCTHAGCGISRYENARMHCPCHGSQFDGDGRPVAGPAPLPLREFPTSLDSSARILTIVREA